MFNTYIKYWCLIPINATASFCYKRYAFLLHLIFITKIILPDIENGRHCLVKIVALIPDLRAARSLRFSPCDVDGYHSSRLGVKPKGQKGNQRVHQTCRLPDVAARSERAARGSGLLLKRAKLNEQRERKRLV